MPVSALKLIGDNIYTLGSSNVAGYTGVMQIKYNEDSGFSLGYCGGDGLEKSGTLYLYAR